MDHLPQDPFMLVSSINTMLRDHEYDSLEELCASFDRTPDEIRTQLAAYGFLYVEDLQQFK